MKTPLVLLNVDEVALITSTAFALPAQYADSVHLKGGLLNNRVFAVKFPVVESYLLCNTTHTDRAINQNGPGGLVFQIF